ncbi:MAG: 50S ribosomal protein L3 [Candidatus Nanoarchaeia archaeon]
MGHIKRKRPRRGSLQFWPRVRAKRIYPAPHFARKSEAKLLGFLGYKAGMTSAIIIDNKPKSPTKGEEIKRAVTIIETPPITIFGIRFYKKDHYGLKVIGEVWVDRLDKNLARKLKLPKKQKWTLEKLKENLPQTAEIRVLTHTNPKETGLGKKKPEILEIPIGGSVEEQFNYASSILGKTISITDVFKEGQYVDVHAVTKGKGFEGDIKRFGVKLASHKAEFGRRHRATMGPITPAVTGWWIAQPGQYGYNTRTEYNKQIIKISNCKDLNINPVSGFSRYGLVKNTYVILDGSTPGPKKRTIVLTHAKRLNKSVPETAPEITHVSLRSQQG